MRRRDSGRDDADHLHLHLHSPCELYLQLHPAPYLQYKPRRRHGGYPRGVITLTRTLHQWCLPHVESPPLTEPFSSGASSSPPSPLGTTTVNVTTLISNDPGRVNIAQTARAVLALGFHSLQLSFLRLTRKQWRDDCQAERRLFIAARWRNNLEREHAALSAPGISPKTASLEMFAEYMRLFDSV